MKLLIDLGNTRLKWRWWVDGQMRAGGSVAHADGQLDALAQQLHNSAIVKAHVAAVARPEIRERLKQLLDDAAISQDWLTSPARGLGLTNSYAIPEKLGIDRFLALAAAFAETQQACCVIDIGTAITVDICDDQGRHHGGLIAPGPSALAQALKRDTALPTALEDLPKELAWAVDTEAALQAGALHSACGLLERSFELARTQLGCDVAMLTGGGTEMLARYLRIPFHIDPDLVFKGLALHASDCDKSQ